MDEINILSLVDEYEKSESKKEFFSKIKIEKYISYNLKQKVIETLIESILNVENGLYTYDPMNKHLVFVLGFISLYTNLIYEEDEGYLAYDALMRNGLVDKIIEEIGYDYADFANLFEESLNAKIQFNNSIPNILNGFLTGFTAALEALDGAKLDKVLEHIK